MCKRLSINLSVFLIVLGLLFTVSCGSPVGVEPLKTILSLVPDEDPLIKARLGKVRIEPFAPDVLKPKQLEYYQKRVENNFNNELRTFLKTPGLFGGSANDVINARAELLSWRATGYIHRGEKIVTVFYEFRVQDGTLLLAKKITSSGVHNAFDIIDSSAGYNASYNSFSNNIIKLGRLLKKELPRAWQVYAKKRETERRLRQQIATGLIKENRYFRIIASNAVLRKMPDAEAEEVAQLSQAELVHATGFLPSGWLQVSKEGRPIGWVHKSVLRENLTSAPSLAPEKLHQPPVVTPSLQRYDVSQSWSVIIGISKYKHSGQNGLNNLIFADDDAMGFARVLSNLGWSESHIKLLVNEEATKRNIEIALESWLTKAGPRAKVNPRPWDSI